MEAKNDFNTMAGLLYAILLILSVLFAVANMARTISTRNTPDRLCSD
ncbi:hypothetical protein HQN86_00535 [Pedobacter panaciterrae]|nr:hypothetical protein [Pedobacter panaciterrae]NQX52089.1 hypothetical protein [Pedobacter panaciterrae]